MGFLSSKGILCKAESRHLQYKEGEGAGQMESGRRKAMRAIIGPILDLQDGSLI